MIHRNFYKFIAESERLALRNLHPDYTLGFPKNSADATQRKSGCGCGLPTGVPQSSSIRTIRIEISK